MHIDGTLSYLISELLSLFGSQWFESMLMTFLGFWKLLVLCKKFFLALSFYASYMENEVTERISTG